MCCISMPTIFNTTHSKIWNDYYGDKLCLVRMETGTKEKE